MSNLPWLKEAQKHIGLQEFQTGDNPKILQWAQLIGGDVARDYTADSIPWCGLFIAYIMSQVGIVPVDKPLWALNWNNFGTKLSEPAFGCVITFKRSGGGHVGLYLGENSQYYYVLGGNQSDSVSVTQIDKSRAQAFRWPPGMDKFLKKGRVKTTIASAKVSVNEA